MEKVNPWGSINKLATEKKESESPCDSPGFPLGLEKWEGIFQSGKSQGILNRLETSGKTTQNTGKRREFEKKNFLFFNDI